MSEPVAQNPIGLPPPDRSAGPAEPPNPLLIVHRALRGRYFAAGLLGLLFALPFAYVGFTLREPLYRSTGLVRVAPYLDKLVFDRPENETIPHFDAFVQTQVMYLSSRRVLDRAMMNPELLAAGWPKGPAGIQELERSLTVVNPPRSEMISVSVTHRDPNLARLAVNAVLGAYEEMQEELSGAKATSQDQTLTALETQHTNELRARKAEVAELAKAYGTTDLTPLFNRKAEQVMALENELRLIESQIQMLETQKGSDNATAALPDEPVNVEALAQTDATLASLLNALTATNATIASSSHLGPKHPDMIALQREKASLEAQRDARVATLRAQRGQNGVAVLNNAGFTLSELQRMRDLRMATWEKLNNDLLEIGRVRTKLADLQAEIQIKEGQLAAVRQTLYERRVERMNQDAGRVHVAQRGELPTGPFSDRRTIFALLGGATGAGLGVGLVTLFGLLRGGYRYIEDIEDNPMAVPLLGTIPDLRSHDPEHDEMAALSVHHLRNMLQHSGPPGPRAVHAITSGSAGDGKTSLALALGMSYAVSGQRTVMLDADLVGRRLSRLLGLSRNPGLTELVGRDTLNGEVHSTSWNNLWVIPAGAAGETGEFSAERLSAADFEKIIAKLRERFDRVIIDTGPVLGSLEATLVCPQADRVIVIVSAGQSPKVVEATVRKLNQLGARCAGMVFNRARRDDFDRSVSAGPLSRSIRSVPPAAGETDPVEQSSLVRALQSEQRDRPQNGGRV